MSSGSTGQPTFWPRFLSDELPIAVRFEQVFHDSFQADQRRTLAVVCFALGTWVGGMFHGCLLPLPRGQGLPDHGGDARQQSRGDLAGGARAGAAVRADGAAGLSAVPEGRDRRRHRTRAGLAAAERWKLAMAGEVFSEGGAAWWASGSAPPTGATTRPRFTAPPMPACLGNETPLSVSIRRFLGDEPEGGAPAVRRMAAADARATTIRSCGYFEAVADADG